ncbi:MAG TPA: MJ0042-type zinc finger domain-containing protein [Gemmataceae bacterium]
MPLQVPCPQCRTKLQVADADRAKQLRCPRCKTVFTARAPASNGNYSSVKPAAPSVKPAAKSESITPKVARPKLAPPVVLEVDDEPLPEKKKTKSMLPACLIGCGALVLLCGGAGFIGGYFALTALSKAANDKPEGTAVDRDNVKKDIEKAAGEEKRRREEQQRIRVQFNLNDSVLMGTITLEGEPPDLEALNKQLLEEMKKKDTEFCSKCADSEKTQQVYRLGGRDNRQLGNVFVWLLPDAGSFFPISEKQLEEVRKREVILRLPHCAFIPHCMFLFSKYRPDPQSPRMVKPTGQVFKIVNDAEITHNVWYKGGPKNPGVNITLAAHSPPRMVDNLYPEAGPGVIGCNIHPWMKAYMRVVDTPYCAISLSDTLDGKDKVAKDSPKFGTYEIKNPPAGQVRIIAWHEAYGYLNKNGGKGEVIELKAEGMTRKDFEIADGRPR